MPTPLQTPTDLADFPGVFLTTWSLTGRTYRFRFWPNTRSNDGGGAWYVDLAGSDGVASVVSVKLTITTDLFAAFRISVPEVPPGRIVVRRTDGVADEPRPTRKGEVGSRVATLGSPLLVVEYVSPTEDRTATG